jgi:hypothetical protein
VDIGVRGERSKRTQIISVSLFGKGNLFKDLGMKLACCVALCVGLIASFETVALSKWRSLGSQTLTPSKKSSIGVLSPRL